MIKTNLLLGMWGDFVTRRIMHLFLISFLKSLSLILSAILVLIGDGPLRSKIERKVQKMGLSHKVKFLGVRSDINRLIQAFDVMVFPSIHEGLPVTLIEAQGAEIPCIISDTITDEVDMGAGLITYENIHSSPVKWAKEALQERKGFTDDKDNIELNGYDIRKSAVWLQDFYLQTAETSSS